MLRMLNFLLIGLMLVGAGVVYDLKYEAERATSRVSKIQRKIDAERDVIATLKAEWSLLNQPKRLQDLAQRYRSYLELDPLDPTQIGTLDDIPFKPAVPAVGTSPTTPASPALPTTQTAASKASIKLAQPGGRAAETTGSIGKLLDRLPSVPGRSGGPTTTGSVPKPVANPSAPMQLVPVTVLPKPQPQGGQPKVTR
jgi:hypothetical protein